jgi:cobalt-precorrin 5A hydrolase
MADHEALIAAGIGCRSACSTEDIVAAVLACLASQGQLRERIGVLCSTEDKALAEPLARAARELGLQLRFFSRAALARHAASALTASSAVQQRFGLPSIAETAALAGAFELAGGAGAVRLLGARRVFGAAACALAAAEPST